MLNKNHVYYNARLNEIQVFDWFWHGFLSFTTESLPDHVVYMGEL